MAVATAGALVLLIYLIDVDTGGFTSWGRRAEMATFIVPYILPLALASRFLSFHLGRVTVSLDTPVFVAAMFHIGPSPCALVVAVTILAHNGWRWMRRVGPYARPEAPLARVIRILFAPIVTATLAFIASSYAQTTWPDSGELRDDFLFLSWTVLLTSSGFLVLQYFTVLAAYWLEGVGLKKLTVETALPGLVSEFAVAPIIVLFVWILDRHRPLPFFVLSATYLVMADVLRRLARARADMLRTVHELDHLVAAGERVFATLGVQQVLRELVGAIAGECPDARRAIAGVWDEDAGQYAVATRTRDGRLDLEASVPGLTARLTTGEATRQPLSFVVSVDDGAWRAAVVPFAVGGEREGFIAADLGTPGPLQGAEVEMRTLGALRRLAGIAGIAIHNTRLYRLATLDGLTGLYVRRHFDRRYAEEVSRARRTGTSLGVLIVDVDDFKRVNDVHGHPAGDRVLQRLADVIRANIRLADVPCRYGGDEFIVMLPDTGGGDAAAIARRLGAAIRDNPARVREPDGPWVPCTASIGVAAVDPSAQGEVPDLVELADVALYEAKHRPGKGAVVVSGATVLPGTSEAPPGSRL
jgi:diguanylate cyclase (GGDEF)-like protein